MLKRILLPLVVAVLTAISAAGEDVVPTRDLTCGCQFCEGSGQWQLLNIVRDNLGSLTHVATAGGTLLAEYSYDAWGRLRDPQTLVPYARGQEPDLRLGRGYTGHEHLPQHGIVHMNARLYDPVTGRFLGSDPVMSEAGLTQTYNSYTYCLNNPLKYTDPDGESVVLLTALVCAGVSMVIDYGIQVLSNYIEAGNNSAMCGNDIWLKIIDWFDIVMSGVVGGVTGGYGSAAASGKTIGTFGRFVINNEKLIILGEAATTSAIDITGEGWQNVSFDEFGQRAVTGLVTMTATQFLLKLQNVKDIGVANDKLPIQKHHFATNKNLKYTPLIQEIVEKYGLDLDGDWNTAYMAHLGRHPNMYHEFVLQRMRQIDYEEW